MNDMKSENQSENFNSEQKDSKCTTPCDSQLLSCSMISSNISNLSTGSTSCPFASAVTWWKTQMDENRAILGYSDGAICVVRELMIEMINIKSIIVTILF